MRNTLTTQDKLIKMELNPMYLLHQKYKEQRLSNILTVTKKVWKVVMRWYIILITVTKMKFSGVLGFSKEGAFKLSTTTCFLCLRVLCWIGSRSDNLYLCAASTFEYSIIYIVKDMILLLIVSRLDLNKTYLLNKLT